MGVSSWAAFFGPVENGDVLKRGFAFGCDAGDAGAVTTPVLVSSLNSLGSKFWKSPSPAGAEAAACEVFRGAYFICSTSIAWSALQWRSISASTAGMSCGEAAHTSSSMSAARSVLFRLDGERCVEDGEVGRGQWHGMLLEPPEQLDAVALRLQWPHQVQHDRRLFQRQRLFECEPRAR
jgi:hypothetical protein